MLVAVKAGEKHHGIGLLGDYLDDPAEVFAVTARLEYRLNQLIDDRLRNRKGGEVIEFEDKLP